MMHKVETTEKHCVFRCGHCRALAVTGAGLSAPKKCGKCQQ